MGEEIDAQERFTDLYTEYYPRVFAYLVSRIGREAAEECASETFLVAWRRYAEMPAAQLPWLLGVARNVVRESYRAGERSERLVRELRDWATASTTDPADDVVGRAAVLAALAGLSEADRETLTLISWHGLSARDAAKIVGCSTATFLVRLHRARRRFAAKLGRPSTTSPLSSERSTS
jgi:RNA polymerase sigma-70 factor, ECF subfamily